MNDTLFIYHGGCFDGFTSAWIYSRFVDSDAEFLGVKYGDQPPDVRGRDVVIADFSFPREVAKVFGGGGHKQAAGFDVADLAEVFG